MELEQPSVAPTAAAWRSPSSVHEFSMSVERQSHQMSPRALPPYASITTAPNPPPGPSAGPSSSHHSVQAPTRTTDQTGFASLLQAGAAAFSAARDPADPSNALGKQQQQHPQPATPAGWSWSEATTAPHEQQPATARQQPYDLASSFTAQQSNGGDYTPKAGPAADSSMSLSLSRPMPSGLPVESFGEQHDGLPDQQHFGQHHFEVADHASYPPRVPYIVPTKPSPTSSNAFTQDVPRAQTTAPSQSSASLAHNYRYESRWHGEHQAAYSEQPPMHRVPSNESFASRSAPRPPYSNMYAHRGSVSSVASSSSLYDGFSNFTTASPPRRPALSLQTDSDTLSTGWTPNQASGTSSTMTPGEASASSASANTQPSLLFSAAAAPSAAPTSSTEPYHNYRQSLHPDSALEDYKGPFSSSSNAHTHHLDGRGPNRLVSPNYSPEGSVSGPDSQPHSRSHSPFSAVSYNDSTHASFRSRYIDPVTRHFDAVPLGQRIGSVGSPAHRGPVSADPSAYPSRPYADDRQLRGDESASVRRDAPSTYSSPHILHKQSSHPSIARGSSWEFPGPKSDQRTNPPPYGVRPSRSRESFVHHEQAALLQSWARLPARPESDLEAQNLLKPYIREYLEATNRMMLGERTVIVMSTSVGQKSYGSERRFLVPPPSALVLGCSWWTHLPDAFVPEFSRKFQGSKANPAVQLFAPEVHVEMDCEQKAAAEPSLEWTTYSGSTVDRIATADDLPVAGRAVGKQLYIPDVKDSANDERSKGSVNAAITIVSPGLGSALDRTIGTFASKPIKVISKPSKKAQITKKGTHNIYHGGTIALFNRLRSQTVSTRFLCVSSGTASFPTWDWQAMTGQESRPFPEEGNSSFAARTTAWDSFVIYAVDPRRSATDDCGEETQPPPQVGYPHPPLNALPVPTSACSMPIYYNQPVVLQCLNTAVVSPVMIIRKVEKGNLAVGGGPVDGVTVKPLYAVPAAPGEKLGEAVSQLHRIALEVMPDTMAAYSDPVDPDHGFQGSGTYLSCLGENVGVRKSEEGRKAFIPDAPGLDASPSSLAVTPDNEIGDPIETMRAGLATNVSARNDELGRSRASSVSAEAALPATNDGGKVKRVRRASAVAASPISGPVKGRKRGASLTVPNASPDIGNGPANLDGLWTQDAGEAGVWTIAGTEISRHTFYIPPICFGGLTPFKCRATGAPPCFLTPIPAIPITNVPVIRKYLISQAALSGAGLRNPSRFPPGTRSITLYGEHFGPDWSVWFGDIPSPGRTPSTCSEVLECLEPPIDKIDPTIPRQLLLVRRDGVIVPSNMYWTP